MDFDVQPTVLVFRQFQTRKATSEWRTVIHALGADSSVQTPCTKAQGHTSRSSGCEEAIKTLLPAVCRLTRKVRRAQSDDASHPPYEAPTLHQVDLFELMSQVAGWSTVDRYGVTTREKALSRVVKCCRGKPSGTTKASTKRSSDTASVRKRPEDADAVMVSEKTQTDRSGRKKPHAASVKR